MLLSRASAASLGTSFESVGADTDASDITPLKKKPFIRRPSERISLDQIREESYVMADDEDDNDVIPEHNSANLMSSINVHPPSSKSSVGGEEDWIKQLSDSIDSNHLHVSRHKGSALSAAVKCAHFNRYDSIEHGIIGFRLVYSNHTMYHFHMLRRFTQLR